MLLLLFSGAKGSAAPSPTRAASSADIFLYPVPAFSNRNDIKLVRPDKLSSSVGWLPEWGFRHDPEELERRLSKQSASNLRTYERFTAAAKAARSRADSTQSEKHRRALVQATEAAADIVADAIDQDREIPTEPILALQAAASATRLTASIKHAEQIIALARDYEDEEEALILLLN